MVWQIAMLMFSRYQNDETGVARHQILYIYIYFASHNKICPHHCSIYYNIEIILLCQDTCTLSE